MKFCRTPQNTESLANAGLFCICISPRTAMRTIHTEPVPFEMSL